MEVMNTSIHISIPTTDLVMGLVDQTDTHLEFSVLANLDIPPQHDKVGKGVATLHSLQGVAGVGLLPGDGLEYWPVIPETIQVTDLDLRRESDCSV